MIPLFFKKVMQPIVLTACIAGMSTTLFAATEEETACIDSAKESIQNVFVHLDIAKDLSESDDPHDDLRSKFKTIHALSALNTAKRTLRDCDMFSTRVGVIDDFKRLTAFNLIDLTKIFTRVILGNPFNGIFGKILIPPLTEEEIHFHRTLIVFGSGALIASTLYDLPIPFLDKILPAGSVETIQDIFISLGLTKVNFARLLLSRLKTGMTI